MAAVSEETVEPSMSDLAPAVTERRITHLAWDASRVTLTWDDAVQSVYPAAWLRDNCACPQCRHPQALERTFMFVDHPMPRIVHATVGAGDVLHVGFVAGSQAHVAHYTRGWLRAHEPAEAAARARRLERHPWDRTHRERLVRVAFDDYMRTDAGLRAWIEAVRRDGIVLLEGVPRQPGTLLEVAHRIGPVRASNFGEYYNVVSMPNPNASAYTAMGLELHTDLANWRSPPDVQFLCCLKSSVRGGESVFADGFRVAQALQAADRAAFDTLCTQALEFRFHDATCDIRHAGPVIEIDREGRLVRVRFNNWLRAAQVASADQIESTYVALGKFWRLLREPEYRIELRLEPGQLVAYDNNRVLHGRAPFDATSGERHLQGCYLNLEDIDSTLRLLERRQG